MAASQVVGLRICPPPGSGQGRDKVDREALLQKDSTTGSLAWQFASFQAMTQANGDGRSEGLVTRASGAQRHGLAGLVQ